DRREALVEVRHRQSGHARQERPELPRFGRLLPLRAVGVHRQTDDDVAHFLFFGQLAEIALVPFTAAALVGGQRRGDAALGVADGQADAHRPVIDREQARAGPHRYCSSPFFFSSSTSCLTVPSSRRSATRVASPSWMMSRFSTPTVAIRWPWSAAIT